MRANNSRGDPDARFPLRRPHHAFHAADCGVFARGAAAGRRTRTSQPRRPSLRGRCSPKASSSRGSRPIPCSRCSRDGMNSMARCRTGAVRPSRPTSFDCVRSWPSSPGSNSPASRPSNGWSANISSGSSKVKFSGGPKRESPFRNPAWYIERLDPSMYLTREYAPLPKRSGFLGYVRAIPRLAADIRGNLRTPLPRPFIERGQRGFRWLRQLLPRRDAADICADWTTKHSSMN